MLQKYKLKFQGVKNLAKGHKAIALHFRYKSGVCTSKSIVCLKIWKCMQWGTGYKEVKATCFKDKKKY